MATDREELAPLVGKAVVIDTATAYVYVGTLREVLDNFLVLIDADAHDCSEGRSGKDLYLVETRRNGIQMNRREVSVRKSMVVSVSKVEDIVVY